METHCVSHNLGVAMPLLLPDLVPAGLPPSWQDAALCYNACDVKGHGRYGMSPGEIQMPKVHGARTSAELTGALLIPSTFPPALLSPPVTVQTVVDE